MGSDSPEQKPRIPSVIINTERQDAQTPYQATTQAKSQTRDQAPTQNPGPEQTASNTRGRFRAGQRNTIRMGIPYKQAETPTGATGPIMEEINRELHASNLGLPFRPAGPAVQLWQPAQFAQITPDPTSQLDQQTTRQSPQPGEVSKETNRRIISQMFAVAPQETVPAHHQPAVQTSEQTTQPAVNAERQAVSLDQQAAITRQPLPIPAVHSGLWQQWADYYRVFPISPAAMPEVEPRLIKSLETALLSLGQELPQYIAESISACRDSSRPFSAVAAHVEIIRNYGHGLYARLAHVTRSAEDKSFIQSARGQEALKKLPQYAHAYEIAPDERETAKKEFRARLRKAVDYSLQSTRENNPQPLTPKYAHGKIAELITENIWTHIEDAVKSLNLPSGDETAIYELLPISIFPAHKVGTNGDKRVDFSTDQDIPDIAVPGNAVARALLKARVLQLAAYGDEEENMGFLWHYAKSMNPETVSYDNKPGFSLTYELSGRTLDHPNFFVPIFEQDPGFFGIYLAIADNNDKTDLVKRMVKYSMETLSGGKKTMAGFSDIMTVSQDKKNAVEFLTGPEIKELPGDTIKLNSLEQGVDELNRLRAGTVRQLAGLMEELDLAGKKIENQRVQIYQMSTENSRERQRADIAEKAVASANKQWRESFVSTLKMLLAKTGWFSKGIAEAIRDVLKKLGAEPME